MSRKRHKKTRVRVERSAKYIAQRNAAKYLMDVMNRQARSYENHLMLYKYTVEITEKLLYAAVLAAGGKVEFDTVDAFRILESYEVRRHADEETNIVTIELRKIEEEQG